MKTLNISIFSILLTATLVVSGFFIFINKAQAETLYVCPEEPEECAYDSIQDAIDFATAGDIINVAAGTYTPTSTININKNGLTLLGPQANVDPRPSQDSSRTAGSEEEAIIDGDTNGLDWIIKIDADNIVINGLEVKSGTEDMISQYTPHSGTEVKYSLIHDGRGDEGVQLKQCTNCTLEYNYVFEIADAGDGLNIADSSSYGVIRYNEVAGIHGENAAIYIYGAEHTEISNNLVRDSGIGGNDGIKVGSKDGSDALKIDVLIKDNVIHDITQDGISVYMSEVTVEGNEIYNCGSENGAIYLAYEISDITIQNNNIHDNLLSTSKRPTSAGILLENRVDAVNVDINFNNIYNNVPYGITNEASALLNTKNNYWGAATGPNTEGADSIDGNVDFTPFYTDSEMTTLSTEYSVCDVGCNFINIQDAIDAASSGDTINVAAGAYEEQVVIDKQLTLNGANADVNAVTRTNGSESIIDGGDTTAVTISADDVIVNGFTLDGGITLDDTTNPINNGTISNNIITGADNPTDPPKAQNGIRVGFDSSYIGLGVDGITIENNIISNNREAGIEFSNAIEGGDGIQRISNITISNNEIKGNGASGVSTYGPGPNTLINNIISDNGGAGMNLRSSSGDVVTGNIITKNTGPGITLSNATNATVENNSVSGHQEVEIDKEWKGSGIQILKDSKDNTIRFNDITDNNYGIFIRSKKGLQPSGNSINFNNIYGNFNYGIFNALVDSPAPVNAIGNYWGDDDETGPKHATTNTSGLGDEVSDNVDYSPWYTDIELTSLKAPTTTDGTGNTVLLTQPIDIISNDIIVSMPAGITITATTSWEGIINTPTIELVASDTPSPESGHKTTIDTIIEIGFSNIKLVFDKAVRILIPNQAGKKVGYTRTGEPFTEITNDCPDDTQITNDDLPPEGDCKIDVGNDLAVWTKHFTQFIVYSYSPIIVGPTFRAEILPEEEPSALSEEVQKLDTNKDEKIDDLDLKELFANWGSIILDNIADFNNDSKVDVFDFNLLMVHWTE